MKDDSKELNHVVQIDESRCQDHLGKWVLGTVEDSLNGLPDAEADRLCDVQRYKRRESSMEESLIEMYLVGAPCCGYEAL